MSIEILFILCANMTHTTHIRVVDSTYKVIFRGTYSHMPDEMKTLQVSSFDFDNDLCGCIINTFPA